MQALVKDLSDVELNKHPTEKWWIAQVLSSHCIRTTFSQLPEQILGIQTAEKSGLKEDLKMLLLIVHNACHLNLKHHAPLWRIRGFMKVLIR